MDVKSRSLQRIYIIGGPGSGKSTLAQQLGACLGAPVFSLDRIAFEGPYFVERPLTLRQADIRRIVIEPRWIAEGMFLGWTNELLQVADAIIWLDHLRWHTAAWRIVVRFTRWGVEEAKRQRGVRKFSRFRDYARHLNQLVFVLVTSQAYYKSPARGNGAGLHGESRAATAHYLGPYQDKVIHCQSVAEIHQLVAELRGFTRPA